jgi:hypothetical protein
LREWRLYNAGHTREVTGLETRSNNRPYLIKRIVGALQTGGHGSDSAPGETAPASAAAPKAKAGRYSSASPTARRSA